MTIKFVKNNTEYEIEIDGYLFVQYDNYDYGFHSDDAHSIMRFDKTIMNENYEPIIDLPGIWFQK